jgi:TfoX/Sxy family transcriptional regulator of competence genes
MASSEEYLDYVLDMLRELPSVTHRKMMGEYLLYSEGILFGGIYDDRLLLKDTPAAREAFPQEHLPYEGAKPMLLVDSENPEFIAGVIAAMLPQLPAPKPKKK